MKKTILLFLLVAAGCKRYDSSESDRITLFSYPLRYIAYLTEHQLVQPGFHPTAANLEDSVSEASEGASEDFIYDSVALLEIEICMKSFLISRRKEFIDVAAVSKSGEQVRYRYKVGQGLRDLEAKSSSN
jgi:hypothetical protein